MEQLRNRFPMSTVARPSPYHSYQESRLLATLSTSPGEPGCYAQDSHRRNSVELGVEEIACWAHELDALHARFRPRRRALRYLKG
jgi:hypothetical protein